MVITPELYEVINKIVEDKVKDIKVTREDFSALKNVVYELSLRVSELAEAQERSEKRLDKLEIAIDRLEIAVEKLAEAQERSEKRLDRLEIAVEKLAEAQRKTENALKKLVKEMEDFKETVGFRLEDLGNIVLPSYLERTYGLKWINFRKEFFEIDSKEYEINLYSECEKDGEKLVCIGEVKNRFGLNDVKDFEKMVNKIEKVVKFPLFKFIFGYVIYLSAQKRCKERNIEFIMTYKLTK